MSSFVHSLWYYISSALASQFFLSIAGLASIIPVALAVLKYIYKPLRIHYSPRRLKVLENERNYLKRVVLQMDQFDRATYWEDLLYTPLEADIKPLYLIPPEFTVLRQPRFVKQIDSPLEQIEGKQENYSDILKVFRKYKEPLVVLGDPGAGKSVSFRHALRDIATDQQQWYRTKPLLPVYIPCGHYTDSDGGDPLLVEEFLGKYLKKTFRTSQQDGLDFERYLAEGRLILFFDALDEMPRRDYAERMHLLRGFAERFSNNRIFFSCRKLDYDKRLQVTEVSIRPFDKERRRRFLRKALTRNFNKKIVRAFIYRLETDAQTAELLNNPFFCQLVVFYISATKTLPRNRYQLFSLYIQRRLSTESQRASKSDVPTESVILMLSSLAYQMSESKGLGTAVTRSEARRLLESEYTQAELSTVIEIAVEAKLLIESDSDLLQFAHHRLQEYFAALFATDNIEWNSDLVPKFCDDLWWREILIMMMGIGEREGEKISTIIQATLADCRKKFAETLDSLERTIDTIHFRNYSLSFAEDLRQKEAYISWYLDVFDPYAENRDLLENLMLAERICDGSPIPRTQRKRSRKRERAATRDSGWRDWIRYLEGLVTTKKAFDPEIYADVMDQVFSKLKDAKNNLRSLRRVVVNRVALSLACATNSGLDQESDTWTAVKDSGLTILENGTPVEQVKIAKEIVVQDSDADIARHLRLLLTSNSKWVAGEVFASLLSFRIPHVGYDWRSIRYLWSEIDRHGLIDMLGEYIPTLLKSFVKTKSILILLGLCCCHLGYIVLVAGALPWAAYLITTIPTIVEYFHWHLIIKEIVVYPVCLWGGVFLVGVAFFTSEIRIWATIIGLAEVILIFMFTTSLNERLAESHKSVEEYLATTERSTSSTPLTKYAILAIVGAFIVGKIIPLLLGYGFYLIQLIRLRRFRRQWDKQKSLASGQQVTQSDALKFYKTFNSDRSKILIIDFLWQTAEFDPELINKLSELADEERNTRLADRLWNLVYELETRQQRAA